MEGNSKNTGNVLVVCRVRPLNQKELARGDSCCLDFDPNNKHIAVNMTSESSSAFGRNEFDFDRVFDMKSQQKDVYDVAARPIIDSVLEGFNGTIFAYGQTSSGKTHTMQGPNIENVELQGIIPRMVRTVFNRIDMSSEAMEFSVKVSMCEIYNERIRDLFDPTKDNLKIHEEKQKGVYIQDISERWVVGEREVFDLMAVGTSNRSITATNMNAESSRSHSLFILTIIMNNTEDGSCKTGKLYLVDLAGSEKISKTGAVGQTLEEAKNINKSLTTLGKVIVALTDRKVSHIPYRESKLTRILSESLGGNAKTCLIITCSPHPFNDAETLSTLRFGARARNIKNAPKVNREYSVAEMKVLLNKAEEKIKGLTARNIALAKKVQEMGGTVPSETELDKMGKAIAAIEEEKKQEEEVEEPIEEVSVLPEIDTAEEGEPQPPSPQAAELLDQLQEKQNELEILQDKLEKELESNKALDKQKCDLAEELVLAQELAKNSKVKKEQIEEKFKELIQDREKQKDSIEDQKLTIDELSQKLEQAKKESILSQEARQNLQEKFENLISNNILIERKKEDKHAESEDTHMLDNLTEEVRKLHYSIQQKDTTIHKLKLAMEKKQNPDAAPVEVDNLLDQTDLDIEGCKEQELAVMSLLSQLNPISEEQITDICLSSLLSPEDIRQLMQTHNKMLRLAEDMKAANSELSSKNEQMKMSLQKELSQEQKEITDRLVQQEEEKQKAIYEPQIAQLNKDLHNRIEKVLFLELQLEEVKDAYKSLESSISTGDQRYKMQCYNLQKNLDIIHQQYQNVASEKSNLKIELQVSERKLQRKEEKITQLEKEFIQSRQKQQDYLNIIKKLKEEFIKVQINQQKIQNLSAHHGILGSEAPQRIQGGLGLLQPKSGRPTIKGGAGLRMGTTPRYQK